MFAKLFSATLWGLDTKVIEVEVDYRFGLAHFALVGLPDKAVQEAKERIVSAIRNSELELVQKKIVVNLAPADMHKSGPGFDLAIAVGLLLATEQIELASDHKAFIGELALDGSVRSVKGILPLVDGLKQAGFLEIFIPAESAQEVSIISGVDIIPVTSLKQLVQHFRGEVTIPKFVGKPMIKQAPAVMEHDLRFVSGQTAAKRALQIAAAGGHNLLFSGVPGSGKTMLAKCLPGILPEMTTDERLEVSRIHSAAGILKSSAPLLHARPFRSPHHNSSAAALVGGGGSPRPGEVTLAHRGVLFLDELPEFNPVVLEALRQPMEDGEVTVSRATYAVTFPARFTLLAAMNPCKCGFLGSPDHECSCSPDTISRYRKRLSGPILDRIDLQVKIAKVEHSALISLDNESSESVRQKVANAYQIQLERLGKHGRNNIMTRDEISKYVQLNEDSMNLMANAERQLNLSARAYIKTLRVARTIADLEGESDVHAGHLAEALSLRMSI